METDKAIGRVLRARFVRLGKAAVKAMNIEVEAGTRVNVISTVPQGVADSPLIMLFVGPRAVALELEEASKIVQKLSSAARTKGKIHLRIDDLDWEIQAETATRIAFGMSRELSKLGVGA